MTRRGFTLVELAFCLTVAAILVPLLYALARGMEDRASIGLWHLETADGVRSFADALRDDAQGGVIADGAGFEFLKGECTFRYRVDGRSVLVRETDAGCGGSQAIARSVDSVNRVPGGVEVVFARALRPGRAERSVIFLPLEAP